MAGEQRLENEDTIYATRRLAVVRAAEDTRITLAKAVADAAREGWRRSESKLRDLSDTVASLEGDLKNCPKLDPTVVEIVHMTIEQVKPILQEQEYKLYGDVEPLIVDARSLLDRSCRAGHK